MLIANDRRGAEVKVTIIISRLTLIKELVLSIDLIPYTGGDNMSQILAPRNHQDTASLQQNAKEIPILTFTSSSCKYFKDV